MLIDYQLLAQRIPTNTHGVCRVTYRWNYSSTRQTMSIYPKSQFCNVFPLCVLHFVRYKKTNMPSLWGVDQEQLPLERIVIPGVHPTGMYVCIIVPRQYFLDLWFVEGSQCGTSNTDLLEYVVYILVTTSECYIHHTVKNLIFAPVDRTSDSAWLYKHTHS